MDDSRLPAVPATDVEEMIFDGEVVDEATGTKPGVPVVPARRVIVLSPVTRHAAYVAAGAVVAVRRWHLKRTRHERMQRALEIQGNHEAMLAWRVQRELERHQRAERRTEMVRAFAELVKVSPILGIILLILMILTGTAMAVVHHRFADIAWPWMTLFRAIALAVEVASVAWLVLSAVAFAALLAWLYHLGRTGELTPRWAVASAGADVDMTIDETAITQALQALRIPQISDYLKLNLPLAYIVPCRMEGRGTYAEVRLPKGVTTEEIGRRRAKLAAGLYRLPTEVWPSMGSDASHLKLWVADKGALAEGAGPYPLLIEGFTDVFKGLPFGRTLRGDPQPITVIGRNTICGGMPEQGKSNGARVVAAGYTLDIITEMRIYVPDINYDFEPFAPRCSRYVCGSDDEHIEQILGDLEELKGELQMRGQLLQDYEEQEVTRALAHAGVGLHPVFWLLEEAHVAIQHRKHGKGITQLLCDVVKLDRKRGVHIMVSTQAPTKDSMPRDVTRNCTNGIAFAVADHTANDALLGQGAYRAGHRATELIPGADRGTALCKGLSTEARSEMVQVHKVDTKRENDQVSPLVRRALAEMARKGRALPGSGRPLAITTRDVLTDLEEVLRDAAGPVRLSDLTSRLRALAPAWSGYKGLTAVDLREQLDELGVRTTNTGNVPRLDPEDLRRVLAERGE